MGPGMFNGLFEMFGCMMALCVVFVPLGLWKAIELLWWVWSHLHWGLS